MILEHLSRMGHNNIAHAFDQELQNQKPSRANPNAPELLNRLSQAFDTGDKSSFFEVWSALVSPEM